jgi:LAO/AO transport system kinase
LTGLQRLLERFRAGDRGALARTLSLIEDDRQAGALLVEQLRPPGNATVVGITGPPGAGKSTLANALIRAYRERGETVGVLAFDPSSRMSGGAALGDRVRMMETWDDDGVYVRSLANRGRLGGLSNAAFGAVRALDAFGFNVILIETVGVGQGEIDIADLADVTILLQVPGAGDTVQLIKAGVLEIAEILVVNKADVPGADELVRDLRNLVSQAAPGAAAPPIVACVATSNQGISELVDAIDERVGSSGADRGVQRASAEVRLFVIAEVEHRLDRELASADGERLLRDVASGAVSPYAACDQLLARLFRH